jgi:hypothetical protein
MRKKKRRGSIVFGFAGFSVVIGCRKSGRNGGRDCVLRFFGKLV